MTGISDAVYTVCAFNDAYFDPKLRVRHYHSMTTKLQRPDPLTYGVRNANRPILNQGEYFLDVVESHIDHVVKEGRVIVQTLEQQRCASSFPSCPLPYVFIFPHAVSRLTLELK
jgi:hypothetical protein